MSLSKKAAEAKKIEVKPSVLDWCRKQTFEDHELTIHWEGGGDSGWVYFQIDGEQVENEYTEYLVDMMCSELDYGSWAGEFCASGSAVFDADENSFIGVDDYSEEQSTSMEVTIPLELPKNLWFDSVSIGMEAADYDEKPRVGVSFIIRNGFISDEHGIYAEKLEKQIQEILEDEISNFSRYNEYRSLWDTVTIDKSEWKEQDGRLIAIITSVNVTVAEVDEKHIYLQINEEDVIKNQND